MNSSFIISNKVCTVQSECCELQSFLIVKYVMEILMKFIPWHGWLAVFISAVENALQRVHSFWVNLNLWCCTLLLLSWGLWLLLENYRPSVTLDWQYYFISTGFVSAWSLRFFLSPKHTYEEAEKGFDETLAKEKGMNRDDRIHGALLILNELVRISSMEGEVSRWTRWGLWLDWQCVATQQSVEMLHCVWNGIVGLKGHLNKELEHYKLKCVRNSGDWFGLSTY